MKILVLMPLDEKSAYMSMGIYKNLPAEVKDKTFCMPSFMDYLVTTKIVPNWEYALFDTLLTSERILDATGDDDIIVLGNVKKEYDFDMIFNFQDINYAEKYADPFVERMRNLVQDEELLANKINFLHAAEESKLSLQNCIATADLLAALIQTDPHLDRIKEEYQRKLKELKHGNN